MSYRYEIRPIFMFGEPYYEVIRAKIREDGSVSYYEPQTKMVTKDREKAEKRKTTKNAELVVFSHKDDKDWLLRQAERIDIKEDELEGYSNISIIGEIVNSDRFQEIAGNLAQEMNQFSEEKKKEESKPVSDEAVKLFVREKKKELQTKLRQLKQQLEREGK